MTSDLHQSAVEQVRARIGATVGGRWHLDALLGMGGMAAVYSASSSDGLRVAIKMLHPALSLNEAIRKRFAREAYVANAIGHTGVVRVLDDGVGEDGAAYLVMDLLEGETLAARATRLGGKLAVNEVAYIGEAVADILAAAHAAHVIHRDIKPENVFITNEGRVVVLDFGIARVSDARGMTDSQTRTGTMMGTPAFMPPEQARGRANEMDATSDVWALGATLFWLASGRVVHEAETPNEQLVAAATLPPPSLGRVAPDVPAPIVAVIDRALEFAKENRFTDAIAMKQALHEAVRAVSWGAGALPSLGTQVATIPPQLPPEGSRTLAEGIGPVEIAPGSSRRATKLVWAGVTGGLVAGAVLAAAVVLGHHRGGAAETQARAAQPTATPIDSAPPAATLVAALPVSVSAPATITPPKPVMSSAITRPVVHSAPRANWLDRRN